MASAPAELEDAVAWANSPLCSRSTLMHIRLGGRTEPLDRQTHARALRWAGRRPRRTSSSFHVSDGRLGSTLLAPPCQLQVRLAGPKVRCRVAVEGVLPPISVTVVTRPTRGPGLGSSA